MQAWHGHSTGPVGIVEAQQAKYKNNRGGVRPKTSRTNITKPSLLSKKLIFNFMSLDEALSGSSEFQIKSSYQHNAQCCQIFLKFPAQTVSKN